MPKSRDYFTLHKYIEDLKKTDLSEYCLNGCENYCCTKLSELHLTLNKEQIFLLYKNEFNQNSKITKHKFIDSKISELSEKRVLTRKINSRDLFWYKGPECPRYDHSTKECEIYRSTRRPEGCSNFPIYFIGENMIEMDLRCDFTRKKFKEIFSELNSELPPRNKIFVMFRIPGKK